jgi:hypothetical protein
MRPLFRFAAPLPPLLLWAFTFASPADGQQLQLTLQQPGTPAILGAPVVFPLELRNSGRAEAIINDSLEARAGNIHIEIAKSSGNGSPQFLRYLGPGWGSADIAARVLHLRAGEATRQSYTVYWNRALPGDATHIAEPFAFPAAGRYLVRARVTLSNQPEMVSNTLTLDVAPPSGANAGMWAAVQAAPQLAQAVQRPSPQLSAANVELLKKLLASFPDAALAPYIKTALQQVPGGAQ